VKDEHEYVHVDEKAVVGTSQKFKAPWTAVSVNDIEDWEHELFQDPKNRLALSALSSADPRTGACPLLLAW
jgi:bleomycin hydrolase